MKIIDANSLPPRSIEHLGQPRGLIVLCLVEMGEKFAYFGTRALLVYYMTRYLQISPANASLTFGLYGSAVYLSTVLGAVLSDRWIGRHRAVSAAGVLIAVGCFAMCSERLFMPGLALLALGSGLFMSSLPPLLGGLYEQNDPRRDAGFNLHHLAGNLGALLAVMVCATLAEFYGWRYGFAAAGLGMVLSVVVYVLGRSSLPQETSGTTPAIDAGASRNEPSSVGLLARIAVAVIIFRVAYEQMSNTLVLWIASNVHRELLGFTVPATWFQALNPLLVLVLTPLVITSWRRRNRQGTNLSATQKMLLGTLAAAVAYALLAAASFHSELTGQATSWLWIIVFFLILTIAEIYTLPVALGHFVKLAPARFGATTVAGWYLASLVGSFLAGVIGASWSRFSPSAFFLMMATVAIVSSVAVWFLVGVPSSGVTTRR